MLAPMPVRSELSDIDAKDQKDANINSVKRMAALMDLLDIPILNHT